MQSGGYSERTSLYSRLAVKTFLKRVSHAMLHETETETEADEN